MQEIDESKRWQDEASTEKRSEYEAPTLTVMGSFSRRTRGSGGGVLNDNGTYWQPNS